MNTKHPIRKYCHSSSACNWQSLHSWSTTNIVKCLLRVYFQILSLALCQAIDSSNFLIGIIDISSIIHYIFQLAVNMDFTNTADIGLAIPQYTTVLNTLTAFGIRIDSELYTFFYQFNKTGLLPLFFFCPNMNKSISFAASCLTYQSYLTYILSFSLVACLKNWIYNLTWFSLYYVALINYYIHDRLLQLSMCLVST
jgi:hypothetical protein